MRKNPSNGELSGYYRLLESYRDGYGEVRKKTILTPGFLDDLSGDELNLIQTLLNQKIAGIQSDLFSEFDSEKVQNYVRRFYHQMISEKKIDCILESKKREEDLVYTDSIEHKYVRKIGAEWLCYQAIEELQLEKFLEQKEWTPSQIKLAITQIISRAVYPASELKTSKWIKENSAVCQLTNYPEWAITKDKLYNSALRLYSVKDELEKFLSKKTNELFDLQDKIYLYDLTNTYFEGEKRNSKLAKYGRSKEKRTDAKLVVLALVVNTEGFIKYSSIYQGDMSDCKTLSATIDSLRASTSATSNKAIIIMDAGIATEENIEMVKAKGYDYLCVTRSKLKNYKTQGAQTIKTVYDKKQQPISLHKIEVENKDDYFIKIKSKAKAKKEQAMHGKFKQRFEEGLEGIERSLNKKHGVKTIEKVHQRIGRLRQKYPSTQKHYEISVSADETNGQAIDIKWNIKSKDEITESHGVYFLRTSLEIEIEETIWKIYNTIREIEYTFKVLKTDLDLRPIYHKNDESTLAHLHLGLLAYWLVNTIRHQLKIKKINNDWTEIVRIANTQKSITTTAKNLNEQSVRICQCSEPEAKLKEIYQALNYKQRPFTKRKSVGLKIEPENPKRKHLKPFHDG